MKSVTVFTFWLSVSLFSNLIGFPFGVFLKWLAVWFKWGFKQVLARAKEFGRATKLPWLNDSLNTAKQLVLWGDSLMERFPRNNDLSWAFLAWDPATVSLVSSGSRDPAGQEHPDSQWDGCICVSFLFPLAPVDWLLVVVKSCCLWSREVETGFSCHLNYFRTSLVFGRKRGRGTWEYFPLKAHLCPLLHARCWVIGNLWGGDLTQAIAEKS